MSATFPLFCPCPRGLEPLLQDELRTMGLRGVAAAPGGVAAKGNMVDVMRINLHSRIASRVLMALKAAPYKLEADIYNLTKSIDWQEWMLPTQTLRVDVTGVNSPLRSLNFATLIIKDAVCDNMRDASGERPFVNTAAPDIRVFAYLTDSQATIYLDTSGEALFKRGWRRDKGEAPLKENLAAGLLMLAGWQPSIPLYDPMCGSGTILIEAAQIAKGVPAGIGRNFGFEKLRNFDKAQWLTLRNKESKAVLEASQIQIYGSDISGDMTALAAQNAALANVADSLTFKQLDARNMRSPFAQAGMLISNPPYGERLNVRGRGEKRNQHLDETDTTKSFNTPSEAPSTPEQAEFFSALAGQLKKEFSGWQAFLFSGDFKLPKLLRLKESARTPLFNGPIDCRLFKFEMVSGSNRKSTVD